MLVAVAGIAHGPSGYEPDVQLYTTLQRGKWSSAPPRQAVWRLPV